MNPIAGPQPTQDVTQPGGPAGTPEHPGNIPIHAAPGNVPEAHTNPIAGGTLARPVPAAPPVAEKELEKDLKAASKEVKAASKQPAGPSKPLIEITLAVLVALGLAAAAYLAFRKSS